MLDEEELTSPLEISLVTHFKPGLDVSLGIKTVMGFLVGVGKFPALDLGPWSCLACTAKHWILPFFLWIISPEPALGAEGEEELEAVEEVLTTFELEGVKVKDLVEVKQMTRALVLLGVMDPEEVLTKNFGVFIKDFGISLLFVSQSSLSSSVYPDPDSGVNVRAGKLNFLSLFCSVAKLRMILAMSDRFCRMTSEGNHFFKLLTGSEKSVRGFLKKLSTYCKAKRPQSLKLGCCGTLGHAPFIVSLSNLRSSLIFALYSHVR